jgi:hypothetical protein
LIIYQKLICRRNKLCVWYLCFLLFIWRSLYVKLNKYQIYLYIYLNSSWKTKVASVKVKKLILPHWNLISVIQVVLWLSMAHLYHCQVIISQVCSDLPLRNVICWHHAIQVDALFLNNLTYSTSVKKSFLFLLVYVLKAGIVSLEPNINTFNHCTLHHVWASLLWLGCGASFNTHNLIFMGVAYLWL